MKSQPDTSPKARAKEAFNRIGTGRIETADQIRALADALYWTCHDDKDPKEQVANLALLSGMSMAVMLTYAARLEAEEAAAFT